VLSEQDVTEQLREISRYLRQEVNRLLEQFQQMRKFLQRM